MSAKVDSEDAPRLSPDRLRAFFHPRRIALVGATDKSRWSQFTYANLQRFGGERGVAVDCVHPTREFVHGQAAVPSLRAIKGQIDLAYVMVPTDKVLEVLQDASDMNIHNLVILTSGFAETGEAGAQLEQQVLSFARSHDMMLLGPNGNGFINASAQLAPYGLPILPPLIAGPVGIVLQSGALASTVVTLAQTCGVGVSLLVSMGNETMMSAADVMDYLIEDENTKVLAVFLESIRQPAEFARVATKALDAGKPIVALKIGRSARSARSAMAHTGALVGDDAVNDAALRQLGVIRVNSLEDLITTTGLLGYEPPLAGRRAGIITPSGGACDILSDRCDDEGIELPDFSPATAARMAEIVPDFSTVHNPLDVTGFVVVDGTLLRRALACAVEDPNFDFVICLVDPPRVEPPDSAPVLDQWGQLRAIVESADKPIIVMSNAAVGLTPYGRSVLEQFGVHVVGGMDHGMTAIGHAVRWRAHYQRHAATQAAAAAVHPGLPGAPPLFGATRAARAEPGVTDLSSGGWSETEARAFLERFGVPFAPGRVAASAADAVRAADEVGYPVALKVQSPDIQHKSDVGGVALDLHSKDEVRRAFDGVLTAVSERAPGSRVDGVLVTPMRSGGTELLVGVVQDTLWGPVLAVGVGGVFVEVLRDTALRVLPVDHTEIADMLRKLRGYPLLAGTRGRKGADLERTAAVIERIAAAALALGGRLQAVEVNPLWVEGERVEALDALIALGP